MCLAVLAGLALFCISMATAASVYPGGTWFDPHTVGHRFWENFWCDLLRERGHGGAPNVFGSRVALGGWLVLSATLGAFWVLAARVLGPATRLGVLVRRLGLVSAGAMVGVFLMPSDRFPNLHGIAITAAGGPGLAALASSVWAFSRRGQPLPLRLSGWILTTFATLNFVIYSWEYWLELPGSPILPPIQKLATLAAIAWMLLVVRRAWPSAS